MSGALARRSRRPAGDPCKDFTSQAKRSEAERAASRRRVHKRAAELREFVQDLKTAPCMDCNLAFPHPAMCFDHVRGEKLFSIANVFRHPTISIQRLLDEIAKCDLICQNCHMIREWNKKHLEEQL